MFFKVRPKTVNDAIAPLARAVKDLDSVASSRNKSLADNRELIEGMEMQMKWEQAELERAENVAKMIYGIINPLTA